MTKSAVSIHHLPSLVVLCLAALVAGRAPAHAAPPERPNVIVLLVDDLGWADLGCYGADLHQTPHIDRFAASAQRFTHAYAAAPVCTPTRASIMTGKHPARLHMTIWLESAQHPVMNRPLVPPMCDESLPLEETTLAEVFRAAGYRTAHLGKWHLGDAAHYPENQGFDINIGGSFWGCPATFFAPYRGLWGNTGEMRYVPGVPGGQPGEYLTDRLTDEALRIIDSTGEQPLYLQLWYHTVHTPIEGKPELVEHYRRQLASDLHHRNAHLAAMVHSLDESVGRILAALEEQGMAENTIVLFSSDNGGFINNWKGQQVTDNYPLRSGKGSCYEGGIRVPLIVRWPGVTTGGAVCDVPVSSVDFFPTLLAIAGLSGEQPEDAQDGVSLVPLLRDPKAALPRDTLYWHYPHYYQTTTPVSALRRGNWKLVEYFEDGRRELFNLADDVSEQHDLAAAEPQRVQELATALQKWRESVGAQLPLPNPEYQPKPGRSASQ